MSDQNNPPEGTPEANVNNPIHEDFINSAPEDLRDAAGQLAPVWDSYVQDKFTEHARYKPLADVSDEEINDFLQYRERIASGETPEQQAAAAKEWWEEYGQSLRTNYPDLFEDEVTGGYEPGYEDDFTQNPMFQQMAQRLEQLEAKEQQAEVNMRRMEAADFVQGELDKVKPQFGPNLADDQWESIKDDICALASRYDASQPDVIEKGFADYQRIVNDTEGKLFEKKLAHPKPAMRGGTTEAHTGPPLNYDEAGDAAKMRIREAMKHGT